jgi:hypothetical protein
LTIEVALAPQYRKTKCPLGSVVRGVYLILQQTHPQVLHCTLQRAGKIPCFVPLFAMTRTIRQRGEVGSMPWGKRGEGFQTGLQMLSSVCISSTRRSTVLVGIHILAQKGVVGLAYLGGFVVIEERQEGITASACHLGNSV